MKPILALVTLAAMSACGAGAREPEPRTVQPGAPGEATRAVTPGPTGAEAPGHTEAEVAFMRAMIPHHAQALAMADLVPGRTDRRDILLAAERIEASQTSEIARMRRWLESRGEEVPPANAPDHAQGRDHAHAAGMHGMATPAQMSRLAAARGEAFDRLFLELMIRHHEGALGMTRELLAREGSVRDPELFQFVSHVDADQRAEIARMRRMLANPLH